MPQSRQVLAFDFGASSGRAMLGSFDGNTISIREIHRFSNDPETIGPGYYWDIVRLYQEIKAGLAKAREAGEFQSLGIDTWGVDYGLIDGKGNLMGLPRHYRTAGTRTPPGRQPLLSPWRSFTGGRGFRMPCSTPFTSSRRTRSPSLTCWNMPAVCCSCQICSDISSPERPARNIPTPPPPACWM